MPPAAAILGCLANLSFPVTKSGLSKILVGSLAAVVGPARTRYHGVLRGLPRTHVDHLVDRLIDEGYLARESRPRRDGSGDYQAVVLTALGRQGPPAWDASNAPAPPRKSREAARLATYPAQPEADPMVERSRFGATALAEDDPGAADRFERLRAWRRRTAEAARVPPFSIFPDTTLRALATLDPGLLDRESLLHVPGIGPTKLERHGAAVLALLQGADELQD